MLEQALGLLVTLLLRNPAAAERAAGAGCVDTVLEAMQAAESEAGFPDSPLGAQWVQRQVCSWPICWHAHVMACDSQTYSRALVA